MSDAIKGKVFSKETGITVSVSLLLFLAIGMFKLAGVINDYENSLRINTSKLAALEGQMSQRWTYPMTRESWIEFRRLNPTLEIPDVAKIKIEHSFSK